MKKLISILATAAIIATLLAGCSSGASGDTVKTGYAVITSIAKSTDAQAGTAGLAEADSTIVAVTVDSNGKVVKCVIDSVQSKVDFDDKGTITTPLDTSFQTKNERGEGYGMKSKSGIGKEWNEQAAAFANYIIGKTSDEIGGIAVDESKHATASDLSSSVTISIGDFITAAQKAIANAQDIGAKSTDKLGIGIMTNIAKSKNATADAAGVAQVYSTYTITTVDANNKITSCLIDASQSNVSIDATGKITADLTAEIKTKDELGAAYGMKSKSGIGKEWNEEASAFANYVVGKTVSDIKGISVNEEGSPTGADLTSSVTISISDFMAALEKAVNTSK